MTRKTKAPILPQNDDSKSKSRKCFLSYNSHSSYKPDPSSFYCDALDHS